MKIKLFIALLFVVSSFSCAINYITWNANDRVKEVELGMSRADLIEKMGKLYIVSSNGINSTGKKEEVLVYKSAADEEFKFTVIDNSLTHWERVYVNAIVTKKDLEK